MPEPMIAQRLAPLLGVFANCFTVASFESFRWLLSGWLLCIGRHTVTGVLRAAATVGVKHHSSFHKFFRVASWMADSVGMCLLKLVVTALPIEGAVRIAIDDSIPGIIKPRLHLLIC